jgi:hypothetical protein
MEPQFWTRKEGKQTGHSSNIRHGLHNAKFETDRFMLPIDRSIGGRVVNFGPTETRRGWAMRENVLGKETATGPYRDATPPKCRRRHEEARAAARVVGSAV